MFNLNSIVYHYNDQEYQKVLGERAVAYINTDSSVVGNYSFYGSVSPLLRQALYDATKKVHT